MSNNGKVTRKEYLPANLRRDFPFQGCERRKEVHKRRMEGPASRATLLLLPLLLSALLPGVFLCGDLGVSGRRVRCRDCGLSEMRCWHRLADIRHVHGITACSACACVRSIFIPLPLPLPACAHHTTQASTVTRAMQRRPLNLKQQSRPQATIRLKKLCTR